MAYLELRDGIPGVKNMVDVTNHIQVDFLFPNGILLPLSVGYTSPLDEIKRTIWREVHKYPLADCLLSEEFYSFMFINKHGEKEEVLDESQNMEEVQPFLALFQLVKTKGDNRGKTLDRRINNLIGRGLDKQESFTRAEIKHFKDKMNEICKEITVHRRAQTPLEKFQWRFPLRLRSSSIIPPQLEGKIKDGFIVVSVGFPDTGIFYKVRVNLKGRPQDVVQATVNKSHVEEGVDPQEYILKVIGQEECIYGEYSLIQFKYIYQCLVKSTAPQFWLVLKSTLPDATPPVPFRRPTIHNTDSVKKKDSVYRPENSVIVWNCESNYRVFIQGISKVQLADGAKIKLYAGLYHGSESLCKEMETEELTVRDGTCNPNIDITFDIKAADLPLGARLCFALYTYGTNMKRKDLSAWVNIPVYDFKRRLQRGDRELPMWLQDLLQQPDEYCYPLGGVSLNATYMETTLLTINFPDMSEGYVNGGGYLVYPEFDKVLECASKNMEEDGAPGSPTMKVSKSHMDQLYVALYESEQLFEQDKELIWLLRYEVCHSFPNSLAKVLQSVKWNNHVDVAKMIALLQTWQPLPVDHALELLDFEYLDHNVRNFAVNCLDSELSDDDLAQFMLQLVQALKFETFLFCPLAEFLLKRALKNQHLGHKLFWLLKSESHNPTVKTQYSLVLDCYLRNNHDHLMALVKQQEALTKLFALNSLIKKGNVADQARRNEAKQLMHSVLNQNSYRSCLSDLLSPLSPLYKLNELKVEKCNFMNSKKRPLWLVWSNADSSGPDIQIIYKNGDDLRQDMLTLQVLQVMDNLWQAEGLDFRMNPYMCMATDREQGMIEVVTPADTIANIQKWYKKTAFDKKALFEWLKDKHNTEESLDMAVEEFLMSCAGYCVATYVLGIGDRHNDNIMMKHSGQMFHIDFGHFLGNFKSKFHVKRERVPFVLTSHFVYVITKGQSNPENFQRFQTMCEKAFLILRNKFTLLMSVFMMMLSGGIPQLSAPKDCNYLRETLVPHLSEADARNHFRKKFTNALEGSWKTSVNFWFHIKAK